MSIPAACSIISSIIVGIFTLAYGSMFDMNIQVNFAPYGIGERRRRLCRGYADSAHFAKLPKNIRNPTQTENTKCTLTDVSCFRRFSVCFINTEKENGGWKI